MRNSSAPVLIALHKPFDVLSQFTPELEGQRTLADFGLPPDVYAIGRLDRDSEGLLLLSDEKPLVDRLLNPRNQHSRRYLAQVEGTATPEAILRLSKGGLLIQGHHTLPCRARLRENEPDLPPRNPPIRYRANIPTSWIELELHEGKNRQVRRMTAAVGFPTLRLVRVAIGQFELGSLVQGEWRELTSSERQKIFAK